MSFSGKLELNITKIPPPMKASKLCKLEMLECKANLTSLIQNGAMRGWWAIQGYDDEGVIEQKVSDIAFEALAKENVSSEDVKLPNISNKISLYTVSTSDQHFCYLNST